MNTYSTQRMSRYLSHEMSTIVAVGAVSLLVGLTVPLITSEFDKLTYSLAQVGWIIFGFFAIFAALLIVVAAAQTVLGWFNRISFDFERDIIRRGRGHIGRISEVTAIEVHEVPHPSKYANSKFALLLTMSDGRLLNVQASLLPDTIYALGQKLAIHIDEPLLFPVP